MTDEPLTIQILKDIRDGVRATNQRLDSLENTTVARFESLEVRFESLETTTAARFESLETTTAARFESLENAVIAGFGIVKDQLDTIHVVSIERHLDLDKRVRALELEIRPGSGRRKR